MGVGGGWGGRGRGGVVFRDDASGRRQEGEGQAEGDYEGASAWKESERCRASKEGERTEEHGVERDNGKRWWKRRSRNNRLLERLLPRKWEAESIARRLLRNGCVANNLRRRVTARRRRRR